MGGEQGFGASGGAQVGDDAVYLTTPALGAGQTTGDGQANATGGATDNGGACA